MSKRQKCYVSHVNDITYIHSIYYVHKYIVEQNAQTFS